MENKSDELAVKRSEEIINACETLYETMKFRDITIKGCEDFFFKNICL